MRKRHTADGAQAKITVNSSVCVDLKGKAQALSLTYILHLCASEQQQQLILWVVAI